jgi:REP element-mobilizing transposase RayT
MPRRKRRIIPDVTYHLISRFVDRDWFICSDSERAMYLALLGAAIASSSWRCLGYAVMSNHIHLAMIASDQPLAEWIRKPHSAFADWMNRTHKRIGTMFVRGPKDVLVPDSRVGHLLAYIHNNPVRAKVVNAPSESTWTSHRFYSDAGLRPPRWLRVDEGLRRAGLAAGAPFDDFVRTATAHPVFGDVDSDEQLLEQLEAYERAQNDLFEKPGPHRVEASRIVLLAAEQAGLTVEQVRSKRRGIAEQRARAVVIICGARLGLSRGEIASSLNVTPQAVSKLLLRDEHSPELLRFAALIQARLQLPSAALLSAVG